MITVTITHLRIARIGRKDASPRGSMGATSQVSTVTSNLAHAAYVMDSDTVSTIGEGIFKASHSASIYILLVSMFPDAGHSYTSFLLLLGQQES